MPSTVNPHGSPPPQGQVLSPLSTDEGRWAQRVSHVPKVPACLAPKPRVPLYDTAFHPDWESHRMLRGTGDRGGHTTGQHQCPPSGED